MKGFKILSAIPVDDLWLDPGNECRNNTNAIPAGTKHIFFRIYVNFPHPCPPPLFLRSCAKFQYLRSSCVNNLWFSLWFDDSFLRRKIKTKRNIATLLHPQFPLLWSSVSLTCRPLAISASTPTTSLPSSFKVVATKSMNWTRLIRLTRHTAPMPSHQKKRNQKACWEYR